MKCSYRAPRNPCSDPRWKLVRDYVLKYHPCVVNMSLGGAVSTSLDDAVAGVSSHTLCIVSLLMADVSLSN
jgi:hypothetical protein